MMVKMRWFADDNNWNIVKIIFVGILILVADGLF